MIENNFNLELSDYEVANLREALVYLKTLGGDTGDWYWQILFQLNNISTQTPPNKSSQEQKRELALRVGWKTLDF